MPFSWGCKGKSDLARQRSKTTQKQRIRINWEDRPTLKTEILKLNERPATVLYSLSLELSELREKKKWKKRKKGSQPLANTDILRDKEAEYFDLWGKVLMLMLH